MTEPTDVIRLYLDDDKEPFKTARPPLRFQFSTLHLADGPHRLRVEAHNGLAGDSIKELSFHVRNGVAITITGLEPGQEIAGQVGVIVNAYAGNTEIDFEPSRAETPAPIPTWAWLIFLAIVAWTMFFLLNPTQKREQLASAGVSAHAGERVYLDVCAKCHQESGLGAPGLGPAPLKDSETVLDAEPLELISFVAAGPIPEGDAGGTARPRSRVRMPAFGPPRLSLMDFPAALNHIRSHWGNQASLIEPQSKRGPDYIRAFDSQFVKALQGKDIAKIAFLYSSDAGARLVRPSEKIDVSTNELITKSVRDWLESVSYVNSMTIVDAAYHVFEGGNMVYAQGHVRMNIVPKEGGPGRDYAGEFIRVYKREISQDFVPTAPAPGAPLCEPERHWHLAFDYATTPMYIGCDPTLTKEGESCPPSEVGKIDFARVVEILDALGEKAPKAQHGNFWELPYKDFVALEFPYPAVPGGTIKMINLNPAAGITGSDTNFVRALRDGKDIQITVNGVPHGTVNIPRMPKGGRHLSANDMGRIISWLDTGMKEKVEKPIGADPRPPPAGMNGTPPPAMADAGTGMEPPAMAPEPPAMGGAAPAGGDWRADDIDYAGALAILKNWGGKTSGAPHTRFWVDAADTSKDAPYAQFMGYSFPADGSTPPGVVFLIKKGDGKNSNLIRAIVGDKLIVRTADGKDIEWDWGNKMPKKAKNKPTPAEIELLTRWIDHGCPETRPAK
jgi:ketosteroid isomerase-like protein/mono/diheme cytochrome c family protein